MPTTSRNSSIQTTQALFVAWQDPETRRYYPVARLISGIGSEQNTYEFDYINGANEAAKVGFVPFRSFPDLQKVYRSEELFALFANRLMPQSRPDYSNYVNQLGLDPLTADPMLILARSGGVRATDSLELFPHPVQNQQSGCYETFFLVHGLRYFSDESRNRVESLSVEDRLYVMADFQNPVDQNALMLRTEDRINVGYLRWPINDGFQVSYATPLSLPGRVRFRRPLGRRTPEPGVIVFDCKTLRCTGTRFGVCLPRRRMTDDWSTRA